MPREASPLLLAFTAPRGSLQWSEVGALALISLRREATPWVASHHHPLRWRSAAEHCHQLGEQRGNDQRGQHVADRDVADP